MEVGQFFSAENWSVFGFGERTTFHHRRLACSCPVCFMRRPAQPIRLAGLCGKSGLTFRGEK